MPQNIKLKPVTNKHVNVQLLSLANIIVPSIGKMPYLLDDLTVTYTESPLYADGQLTKCIINHDFSQEMHLTNVTVILPYQGDDGLQFADISDWLLETKITKNYDSLTCSNSIDTKKLNKIYQQLHDEYGTDLFFEPISVNDFELKKSHKAGFSVIVFSCLTDHVIKYDDQIIDNCVRKDSINFAYWLKPTNGEKKYYPKMNHEFVETFNNILSPKDFINYINVVDKKKQEPIPVPPKGYEITQGED